MKIPLDVHLVLTPVIDSQGVRDLSPQGSLLSWGLLLIAKRVLARNRMHNSEKQRDRKKYSRLANNKRVIAYI